MRAVPTSIELERRIARLKRQVQELLEAQRIERKRMTALQAQLDHLLAKRTHS